MNWRQRIVVGTQFTFRQDLSRAIVHQLASIFLRAVGHEVQREAFKCSFLPVALAVLFNETSSGMPLTLSASLQLCW